MALYTRWQLKDHERVILEMSKKGDSSVVIARFLIDKIESLRNKNHNTLARRIREFIQYKNQFIHGPSHHAKILIYDLEVMPLKGYIWRLWQQNINAKNGQLISVEGWPIVTWSAKWLFDDKVMSGKMTSKEAKNRDDSRLVADLWDLVDQADILIGHYIKKFDNRMLNSRFLIHGLKPPSSYQSIDTKYHSSKQFMLPSYSMDAIAIYLGLPRKLKVDFELWEKCMDGDQDALESMEKYNIQDILTNEEVYLTLLPWIKPHPNLGLFIDKNIKVCPSCAHDDLEWTGNYYTNVNQYDEFRCNNCGSVGHSRCSSITVDQKRFILKTNKSNP